MVDLSTIRLEELMRSLGKQIVVLFRQLNLFLRRSLYEIEITASELLYFFLLYEKNGKYCGLA